MHKFIRSNKTPDTLNFVCEYNWPIELHLNGRAIVVRVYRLDDIVNISRHVCEPTKIAAFVYRDDFASLETIDVNPAWGNTPVILYINRLGQFRDVSQKIELLKSLNVIVIFTGAENEACKDAQILSSLGIHTGIDLKPGAALSDSVLDLMTYTFYSTMPHAPIEPFNTMEQYYDGESYVSPELARFVNPERYIHIDKDLNMAFSADDLKEGKTLPEKYNSIKPETFANAVDEYSHRWQQMFVDSHRCTFCPAFRVCMGYFDHGEDGDNSRCRAVMNELLESIEFQKSKKQHKPADKCQL